MNRQSGRRAAHALYHRAVILAACCLSVLLLPARLAQCEEAVCKDGVGSFAARFVTGVGVRVGPSRKGEFATRTCSAVLEWEKQELRLADGVSLADLDAFGIDLDVGTPIAAFEIRKSGTDCCATYEIFSLQKPPQRVRTLTGADSFSAVDTDLDGHVEIWTHDAAAVQGFDGLVLAELDSAPTVILRFVRGKLWDVSSEFQPFYDYQIAQWRAELDPRDVHDFKSSNGRLKTTTGLSADTVHRLRTVKAKVLEIVWAYLYSGRDQDAWQTTADLWPPSDRDRIRKAILDAREHGLRSQVDEVAKGRTAGRKKRVPIFEPVSMGASTLTRVVPPYPILIWQPLPVAGADPGWDNKERVLELVIDSAGKVRSAEPSGKVQWDDPDLIRATAGWKFTPAYKAGRGSRAIYGLRFRRSNRPKPG